MKEHEKEPVVEEEELSLDDLGGVSGGSLRDVVFETTVDISKDTQEKIVP